MPRIFTDFVRALEAGAAEPLVDALWSALHTTLRHELHKRGLWESPPSYLGIQGWESWELPGAPARRQGSALEELAAECYSYIFVKRLRSLTAHLSIKPNIEGLVFLNLRHFLLDRQREHDPLGFRVFFMLEAAVRGAVDQGELVIVESPEGGEGEPLIRNETRLAFARGPGSAVDAPVSVAWNEAVVRFNDDLVPDLIVAYGKQQETVVARLRAHLRDLPGCGRSSFLFKELIDPLKRDLRQRWAAVLEQDLGAETLPAGEPGAGERVRIRLVPPDTSAEDRQHRQRLARCVAEAIGTVEADGGTRDQLSTLWAYLRVRGESSTRLAGNSHPGGQDDTRLSQRKLAERLGIPRERLPRLLSTLEELGQRCQARLAGRAWREKEPHAQQPH